MPVWCPGRLLSFRAADAWCSGDYFLLKVADAIFLWQNFSGGHNEFAFLSVSQQNLLCYIEVESLLYQFLIHILITIRFRLMHIKNYNGKINFCLHVTAWFMFLIWMIVYIWLDQEICITSMSLICNQDRVSWSNPVSIPHQTGISLMPVWRRICSGLLPETRSRHPVSFMHQMMHI